MARGFEQFLARVRKVIGHPQQGEGLHDAGQRPLALDQRHAPQVVTIEIQQIEDIQMHRVLVRHFRDGVGILNVNARLDHFELRDAFRIQHDDFAIENRLLRFDVMRQNL